MVSILTNAFFKQKNLNMQGPIKGFNYQDLVGSLEKTAFTKAYARTMKGIHSASIKLIQFKFGKPETDELGEIGIDYRKFFYNANGDVVKKLSFNADGELEMKEEYEYDDKNRILSSQFTTADSFINETYQYDSKGNLTEYFFNDAKKGYQKSERNEWDAKGRITKTTSYGLMGTPELISNYIHEDGTSQNYTFKEVTKPDGTLVMTFYFIYGTHSKDSFITGLYGFALRADEINKLLKQKSTEWERLSEFRSNWEYKAGKPVSYSRDEKIQKVHFDLGYPVKDDRIVTERSVFEYEPVVGKNSLVKTTEWLTKFMEPYKELKKYTYFDDAEKQIYPLL
jgi:hypothetical protein